jgi:hypothetical protein
MPVHRLSHSIVGISRFRIPFYYSEQTRELVKMQEKIFSSRRKLLFHQCFWGKSRHEMGEKEIFCHLLKKLLQKGFQNLLKNAMIKRIHCSKLKLCNMNRRIFG